MKILLDKINQGNDLGNGIIDPLLKNVSGQKFFREIKNFENNIFDHRTIYKDFTFRREA